MKEKQNPTANLNLMEMGIRRCPYGSLPMVVAALVSILRLSTTASGYGCFGPVAAAFGGNGFFCAIDVAGKQEVVCWDKYENFTASSSAAYLAPLPPMASLSGGEEFLCGITSNTSQPFCFKKSDPGTNLVPPSFQDNSYSQIAAGQNHACGIRETYYSVGIEGYGRIDCWEFNQTTTSFSSLYVDSHAFKNIVAGDGFSCGVVEQNGVICWGPRSAEINVPAMSGDYEILASGRSSVCGISSASREVHCWGSDASQVNSLPMGGDRFVRLTAGADYFCGVREDNHEVQCWGYDVDPSSAPMGSGFTAIASSDYTACGIREVDLVVGCWSVVYGKSPTDYKPPAQLCSPGTCSQAASSSCPDGMFSFDPSILDVPNWTNICARKDLKICLPCGTSCSHGYFVSTQCTENADRKCTSCSLCNNSSCWDTCGLLRTANETPQHEQKQKKKLVLIIGMSLLACLLLVSSCCVIFQVRRATRDGKKKRSYWQQFCICKPVAVEADPDPDPDPEPIPSKSWYVGKAQVFRLSDLKDATHGFKEFNELGRGSFGFVYKAVLSDGRQVVVKRANAATIIHTNNRQFESELEILCRLRHRNIVNLLGYCTEMGERLLVYEYIPQGTLYDHLHGELSPLLDWSMRLRIAQQVARGLEYMHNGNDDIMAAAMSIVHGNLRTSKVLLDSEWRPRIGDFGFSNGVENLKSEKGDVYDFGIVVLEILSGRKAYDKECNPHGIVEWAVPLIRSGNPAAIIDKNVALPENMEPLLKLADVAEAALRDNPIERPDVASLSNLLDEIVKMEVDILKT
ncbi:unnamed protein product [Linum trigynum]|uniref:non-specific serine/threonine protein kinase n=2 Tax=Linum trigynum TaxID=586398 RepID=A0AAV2DMZ0_9ROSI